MNKCFLYPPPAPGKPKLTEAKEKQIIAATMEGAGSTNIAVRCGVSHTTVLRVWRKHSIDRGKLIERNRIVEANRELATRIAKSVAMELPLHMRGELAEVALVALTEVAASYDASRGVPFPAYAQQRIRGACLDSIRRRHYKNSTASEYSAVDSESRADGAASHEAEVIDSEEKQIRRAKFVSIISGLQGRPAVILWLKYIEHQSLEAIAEKLGIVASRVSQIHTEAVSVLKQQMGAKA